MSYTKPESSGRRVSWQLQAIEANRQGDAEKMKEAFDPSRKGSNINCVIVNGAYGGYRFPTWGKYYGGTPNGQSMLHLVVRRDNECYPNRYLLAKTLVQNLHIDTSIRDDHELPARRMSELAQMTVDAVHPLKNWSIDDCVCWLEGLGEWTKKNRQWTAHFLNVEVDGALLVTFLSEPSTQSFSNWLAATHSDLAHRDVYKAERNYVIQGLAQLLKEFKKANAYRRMMEKPFIMEARRVRKIEERGERREKALMAYEESQQFEREEREEREETDAVEEEKWREVEARVGAEISTITGEIDSLNERIALQEKLVEDPSVESLASTDSKGKKRRGSVSAAKKVEAEKARQEAQVELSRLKDDLDVSEKELARLEESLATGKEEQADRDAFKSWLELNDNMREIDLDMVYDTIDIEEMEDVIGTYPNICKDEEQRMEKLALVEERNNLRSELDSKYWGDEVEQDRLRLAELWVALVMKELPRLDARARSIAEEMDELGEGEDAEDRFRELDVLQGRISRRRYHRGEIMLPQSQKNVDDVRRRIQAKADAEREVIATREKEDRAKQAREEELRKIKEMGMPGEGAGDDDDEEDQGFRVKVDSSDSGDSDDSSVLTDSDEDDEDEEHDHDDSDDAFGSDDEA
mmetsp:Transcript_19885/g.39810  ORF Transcript_19885/g.39810 Transcript_19885/m.39810 type:complete len:637 (+) Transcript_19885:242-2152(+)|eukprot:CAMPEP_0182484032 /NCGR_PEP_ID=MMETSP1319-20130603/42620_1 /TAXON_ID=172717 /ORGANISM="Bolidomonas pacifica, Strain RCC208" /LENGTH=636 /DNA_ID=CAMNT_0024685897 /DNA_START=175 /DNA_END=2085 /DNA_ORIENTATION=+